MVLQKIKTHLFPKGFTLIELIVVITILAILGTIGFLSIGGYSSKARDSARISDVANLSKSLDVSIVTVGSYPTPDNSFAVTYSGGTIWNQGFISTTVLQALRTSISGGGLSKKPVDPLDNSEYEYSSLAFGKAYQIKAEYEGDLNQTAYQLNTPSLTEEASAAPGAPSIAYIKGNYGGLVAKTVTGSMTYALAIPSIMTNTGTANIPIIIENNHLSGALLFNGKNLKNASTFNPISVVYGKAGDPSTSTEALNIAIALQSAYSGANNIASNQAIATLLATPTAELASLAKTIVNNQLGGDSKGINHLL
ncbi:MAG: prepilin-type N-terminal cleavage/methylation domain-containing protein [Candidatus Gracilibacteria bacterium]|nr:prepilin-type N-terminal cleavage/methylation domain-containing protein [Candidatus Gracilibacteria bacterium]